MKKHKAHRLPTRCSLIPLTVFLFSSAIAQEPERFVSASVCGSCHSAQYESQVKSGHARTLHHAPQHPLAAGFVPQRPLRRPPNYRFHFSRADGQITVSADDGEYVMDLPLEWAVDAGEDAEWVDRDDSQ